MWLGFEKTFVGIVLESTKSLFCVCVVRGSRTLHLFQLGSWNTGWSGPWNKSWVGFRRPAFIGPRVKSKKKGSLVLTPYFVLIIKEFLIWNTLFELYLKYLCEESNFFESSRTRSAKFPKFQNLHWVRSHLNPSIVPSFDTRLVFFNRKQMPMKKLCTKIHVLGRL